MSLCYTCDERDADWRYPVLDNFEGWGGRPIGHDCEECAEMKWDMYQEFIAS